MKDKDMLLAEQIRSTSHSNQAEQWKLRYFAALDGIRSEQRGNKRLLRKLEARNAYIKAAEVFLSEITVGNPASEGAFKVFQEIRERLGYVKKPRPEGK